MLRPYKCLSVGVEFLYIIYWYTNNERLCKESTIQYKLHNDHLSQSEAKKYKCSKKNVRDEYIITVQIPANQS